MYRIYYYIRRITMKKALSLILAFILAFAMLIPSGAASEADSKLQFNDNGKFRIMQIADIQDGPFLLDITRDYIEEMVVYAKPDLVVLTGDNISAGAATIGIHKLDLILVKAAIDRYMSIFEKYDVPVAVVFGNHDAEEIVSKEEQMAMYMEYGCCVAVDEGDALYGCGTYNVPIYSKNDAGKIAYNLWMIDSNMYDDVNGGYDHVHQDQIDWYVKTSNELKAQNGGAAVPSMMFQHIIVNEIYDVITEIPESEKDNYEYVEERNEETGVSRYYAIKNEYLRTGELNEMPCPGAVDSLQFETAVAQGDVVAMFFGHDHKNSFEVEYQGIDLVNTPGVGFNSYGDHGRGVRIIDIEEGTRDYETEVIAYQDYYADNKAALERFVLYGSEHEVIDQIAAFFKYIWFSVISIFAL